MSKIKIKRGNIMVEHHDFNWDEVKGQTLKDAAEYLNALAQRLPPDAVIDEHWSGYEDMTIRVISYRDETDEELAKREIIARNRAEWEAKRAAQEKDRAERLAQYRRLRKEFE
jgi:hypothetical protein